MGKTNPGVTAFNGGEVGPEALARSDLENYPRVAAEMLNIFPTVQGGMSKAPGSKYIATVSGIAEVTDEDGGTELDEDGDTALSEGDSLAILHPFIRPDPSGDALLALEFSANQVRFIDDATEAYVTIAASVATIGAWSDESSAPSSGGGAPLEPGTGDVGDPFYPDIDYGWISGTEGGGYNLP